MRIVGVEATPEFDQLVESGNLVATLFREKRF